MYTLPENPIKKTYKNKYNFLIAKEREIAIMRGMNYIRYQLEGRDIFVVDMKLEKSFPFSEVAEKTLQKMLSAGKRVTIIASRKGFAGGMICKACGHIPHCSHCDIPVAYHKTIQ